MPIGLLFPAMLVPGLVLAVALAAQEPPRFEVASIKPNVSGEPGPGGTPSTITRRGDTFVATNTTLMRLIQWAYPLERRLRSEDRVIGGPAWARQRRFDIEAKVAGGMLPPYEQLAVLVQALLEDRFGLIVGHGLDDRDVYAMRLAGRDTGAGAAMLRRSADECAPAGPPSSPSYSAATIRRYADRLRSRELEGVLPRARFRADCVTMSRLARNLASFLNTDVFDDTGLDGQWALSLNFADDGVSAPTLFVAVEDQLGLRLERVRRGVDVLIIEEVHPPIEN